MKVIIRGLVACALVAIVFAAGVEIGVREGSSDPRPPAPNTAESVGKCIQGQRVYYHVTRGEAAETCLAQLGEVGERRFSRTWHNFETELAYW